MEGKACMYSKFGFCKFKDQCKRIHFKGKCEDAGGCKGVKVFPKRHPKLCKRYLTNGGCRFGSECSYQHAAKAENPNVNTKDLEKKVEVLENMVSEMAKKNGNA